MFLYSYLILFFWNNSIIFHNFLWKWSLLWSDSSISSTVSDYECKKYNSNFRIKHFCLQEALLFSQKRALMPIPCWVSGRKNGEVELWCKCHKDFSRQHRNSRAGMVLQGCPEWRQEDYGGKRTQPLRNPVMDLSLDSSCSQEGGITLS